ncbi:hypothetical protein Slin15195_G086190 [Septoria linicola]|uniref:Hydrophobin n=1 Tax=Septoria linicola TaxID=215465 RepID=A0A9Q9AZC5_9PEZI|nr:hypothetical protein Slin14017_G088780 [Septoria linicola]USW55300.1 hypothetical protein Slin15195_G086190 [Septoria linicola]
MQFSTIFSIFASVAVAAALPAGGSGDSATQQASQCGTGNAVSCCNSANNAEGLLGLGNILGGSCSIQVPVLAGALGNSCNAGNTFCCPTNQDGAINAALPCVPLNV